MVSRLFVISWQMITLASFLTILATLIGLPTVIMDLYPFSAWLFTNWSLVVSLCAANLLLSLLLGPRVSAAELKRSILREV